MIDAVLTKRYGGREVLGDARLEVAAGTVQKARGIADQIVAGKIQVPSQ